MIASQEAPWQQAPLWVADKLFELGCNVMPMLVGTRSSMGKWTLRRDHPCDLLTLRREFRHADARPGINP